MRSGSSIPLKSRTRSRAKKLRERVGESMGSIRSSPPLARVTTSSLEALRLYSQALSGGPNAPALYEQAIALDSGFAMAWRGLGIIYRNRASDRARMVEAYTRAYELRDRLSERERHLAAGMYYGQVLNAPGRAVLEYEAILQRDPDDKSAVVSTGVLYGDAFPDADIR